MAYIYFKVLKILCLVVASSYGVVASTLDFKPIDCRFESWSRQDIFNFFLSKMSQKVKKFVSLKARVPGKCQVSFYPL